MPLTHTLFLHLTSTLKPKSCPRTHMYHKSTRKSITNSYSFCKTHFSRGSGRNHFGLSHIITGGLIGVWYTYTHTHKHTHSFSLSLSPTHTPVWTHTHTHIHTNTHRETATCKNAWVMYGDKIRLRVIQYRLRSGYWTLDNSQVYELSCL
jgi:hypothetical protein